MSDDADRIWLDTLAGRASAEADREAEGLRRQLLARAKGDVADAPARDPAREDALLARARSAGLLPAASRPAFWTLWRSGPVLALAGLAGVALLAGLLLRPGTQPDTVRSAPGEVVRLTSSDPAMTAERVVHDLRAAGVEATRYVRLGRQGIDADLPQPLPSAVRSVLRRHKIPEPADGVLQLEIEDTTGP